MKREPEPGRTAGADHPLPNTGVDPKPDPVVIQARRVEACPDGVHAVGREVQRNARVRRPGQPVVEP